LALSVPVVIVLVVSLLVLNFVMAVIILGGLLNLEPVIQPYIGLLTVFLLLGLATMFVLFRSVIRYSGGIHKLWQRLRGIQEEQARVERLMEKQNVVDEVDVLDADDEEGLEHRLS
jgi:hypothetical protein